MGKKVDGFIGTQFPTPKGGVLTVKEVIGENYILECSICSKDEELWPYGSIKSFKGKPVRMRTVCGCAHRPFWTESQYKVRVKRECDKRGYIFHGWSEEYNKNKTHLDLENPKTGNRWDSTCIGKLLIGRGDPLEWVERFRKIVTIDDNIHIKKFIATGKFLEGTEFFRSDRLDSSGFKTYWKYICPSCSKDEYVKNNICTGIFEGSLSGLKAGQPSCRCSPNYRWSRKQREYQINKICNEEEFTFIKWKNNGYLNNNSRFEWTCKQGHRCESSVNSFINANNRCGYCTRKGRNYCGYYPERKDEKDYLYILIFDNLYIKVGRSFEINRRLKELVGLSDIPLHKIEKLAIYTGTHQNVWDTEQWLHEELTERGFYHHESTWTIETFTTDCYQCINYLMKRDSLSLI